MLTLKIMSGQDLADSHPSKAYLLVHLGEGSSIAFNHEGDQPKVQTVDAEGNSEVFSPEGNCYVLEGGKTIATFAHMPPPPTANLQEPSPHD